MSAEKIWTCKIGGQVISDLPPGSDSPMRDAVAKAFEDLTGVEDEFLFSGWGGELTVHERSAVNDRLPTREEDEAYVRKLREEIEEIEQHWAHKDEVRDAEVPNG